MDEELIDDLVEEITVDARGDEGYWAFLTACEDVPLPAKVKVVGVAVDLVKVDFDGDERRGLTARVRRGSRTWTVSVLDLEIAWRSKVASELAASKRWLGA